MGSVALHRGDFTPEHTPIGAQKFQAILPRDRVKERGEKDAVMLFSQAFD